MRRDDIENHIRDGSYIVGIRTISSWHTNTTIIKIRKHTVQFSKRDGPRQCGINKRSKIKTNKFNTGLRGDSY